MKKLLLLGLLTVSMAVSTFAFTPDIELDVSYYNVLHNSINSFDLKGSGPSTTMTQHSPVGINLNGVFYAVAPAKNLDIGVSANIALDTFNSITVQGKTENLGIGRNVFIGIGPAFRFNIGSSNSVYLCPQYMYGTQTVSGGSSFGTIRSTYSEFSFDLGYRSWFVHNGNFDMGLGLGYQIGVPIAGKTYFTSSDVKAEGKVKGNLQHKIYIGACFNFGQRSNNQRAKFKKL